MSEDTFLALPRVEVASLAAGQADIVIVGVPFGVPYPEPGATAGCSEAPAAIRARSQRLARFMGNHDFDLGGPLIPDGSALRVVDAGDVAGTPQDGAGNAARAEEAVRAGFTTLGLDSVVAYTVHDNEASQAVMRKLGGPLWKTFEGAKGNWRCGNCHFPPNAEKDYDYVHVRDAAGNTLATYTGLKRGQGFYGPCIPTASGSVTLTSDSSATAPGFTVDGVRRC